MPQLNNEDAKAGNKGMLAISPKSKNCHMAGEFKSPPTCRFLAPSSRLRAFVVRIFDCVFAALR